MDIHDTDVLICGAGPTGLTLACDLRRRGINMLLVDQAAVPPIGSRGKGVQPRSLEVFDDLGIAAAVMAAGGPPKGMPMRLYRDGRLLGEMPFVDDAPPKPGVPYPNLTLLPQWRTEQILRERLTDLGGDVLFGHELVTFTRDASGVSATIAVDGIPRIIRAKYLVGSDGGHSRVRHVLGETMAGRTNEEQVFLLGDVKVEGLDFGKVHAWFGADRSYLGLGPLPGTSSWQFQANVFPDPATTPPEPSLELFQEVFHQRTGLPAQAISDATWLSKTRFNARIVDRYRHDRVFLAGDAAHVHSPAGGMGMNTGIQDAYNLGWKLAWVLRGMAREQLLDTYHDERRPIGEKVLADSSAGFDAIFVTNPLAGFVRDHVLFPLTRIPFVSRALLARTYQLRLNYPDSSLSHTEGRQRRRSPVGGDRAPDARGVDAQGNPTTLFDFFRGPHATLLVFGWQPLPPVPETVRVCRVLRSGGRPPQFSGPIFLSDEAYRLYGARANTLVFIRPDGYIGLRATGGDSEMLWDHYIRWVTDERDSRSWPRRTTVN